MTASFELNYGLFPSVEVGVELPLLTIFYAPPTNPRTAVGLGDTNLSVKYNFLQEADGKHWPALTLNASVELPTGDASRQLGSGLTDVWFNTIAQKSLPACLTWCGNFGVLFAGNTATGVIGIQSRGTVLTGGRHWSGNSRQSCIWVLK